jgi:hypothetical protein
LSFEASDFSPFEERSTMIKNLIFVAASVLCCCQSFSQSLPDLYDYFPLSVGREWTYVVRCDSANGWPGGTFTITDTGMVSFRVMGMTEGNPMTWIIEEEDSVLHRQYYSYPEGISGDTSYMIFTTDTFSFYEKPDSLHLIYGNASFPPWRLPIYVGSLYLDWESSGFYRYGNDSTVRNVYDIASGFWNGSVNLQFDRDIGLVLSQGNLSHVSNNQTWYRWTAKLTEHATAVPENTVVLPGQYSILQNYPNPFNPATTIEYQLKTQSRVNISIYDVLGREITTLIDEQQPAGEHRVTWNAADIPSGVYFCRIHVGNFNQQKKMVLVK